MAMPPTQVLLQILRHVSLLPLDARRSRKEACQSDNVSLVTLSSSFAGGTHVDTIEAPGTTPDVLSDSQFNNLTFDPPYIMFSANQSPTSSQKDTVRNAESTGYFCWQLATYALREAVNISAEQVPYGVDEFDRAGLEKTYSTILPIKIPMVARSPVRFECAYHSTLRLPGNPPMGTVDVVIGRVLGIHVDDGVLTPEGKIDVSKTEPIARCGYYDYAVVRETFEMIVPGGGKELGYGMEGSVRKHKEQREREAAEREAAGRMGVEGQKGVGPP
jgi:flavin reductase (DIM6/NTAB) family NADH-FMN oxidoreductase RutF